MDDPNITMEEYIRLEEEKARRCVRCITWKLLRMVRSGIIVHDLGSVETEFPAIVFNDTLTSEALLCEPKHSKNDNEKVNMPSFPPPKPTVSCFDDLDFFKDFKNEFPAIVYNDAQTSKLDFLTEPTLSPQHIDEFNLKMKHHCYRCDEL
ncbi:hypothetical protein Tco_1005472 [Tanacetum coccineum]|uniref:Uncharacterized protein n=1 Tax=Tanacetum coccineum TaxID=301880 RepID=A0ABQ5FG25_9ASTR